MKPRTLVWLCAAWLVVPASLSPSNNDIRGLGAAFRCANLKGELRTVTAQQNFQLLVMAENDPRVTSPTGPVVMQATIPQTK